MFGYETKICTERSLGHKNRPKNLTLLIKKIKNETTNKLQLAESVYAVR